MIAVVPAEVFVAVRKSGSRLADYLLTYFIALRPDAGTYSNAYFGGIGSESLRHRIQCCCRNAVNRTAPAGMAGSQHMAFRIVEYDGDAVSENKKEGQLYRICDEGIAAFLAGAGLCPANTGNSCTVDLVRSDWVGGVSPERSAEAGEVFKDTCAFIAAAMAEVQTAPWFR